MTNGIAKQSSLRLGLGLALALSAACDDGSPSPDDDASFRDASQEVLSFVVIDDFKTGPVQAEIDAVDWVQTSQEGAGILGDWRCLELGASVNPFERPLSAEVIEGGYGLALESGVGIHHGMSLIYGPDEDCGPSGGLAYDFTPYTHLRLEFAPLYEIYGALDQGLGGGIVVWSTGGTQASSITLSIDAQTHIADFALAEFQGDVDWADVYQIDVVMQSGGPVPGHDYILQSFSAVELSNE